MRVHRGLIWKYVWGWLVVRRGFIEVNCFGVYELIEGSLDVCWWLLRVPWGWLL